MIYFNRISQLLIWILELKIKNIFNYHVMYNVYTLNKFG